MTSSSKPGLRFASSLSTANELEAAFAEITQDLKDKLSGRSISFAAVFLSVPKIFAQRAELKKHIQAFMETFDIEALIGCSGSGVIAAGQEIEHQGAVAVFAGSLPEVQLQAFHCNEIDRRRWQESPTDLGVALTLEDDEHAPLFLLSDPYTFDIEQFLGQLEDRWPQLRILGGLSSGARAPGMNLLICNSEIKNNGCVGLQVRGHFDFYPVVSQGCRPIGRHAIVTRGQGYQIQSIRGQSPRKVLKEVFLELTDEDRQLVHDALLIGRVINEQQHEFHRGDFLIRPILKLEEDCLIIADHVRTGQTVQFHVRDANTAREELEQLLKQHKQQAKNSHAALMFSCNGRGRHLFQRDHHDIGLVQSELGEVPVAGFFCSGEIGPVGNQHFLHGFTNSLGLFCERSS